MSLVEKLKDFAGALATATRAPDEYNPDLYVTYESNMADLKELWGDIRTRLKVDADKVAFIDEKLQEAFVAFESGEKQKGQQAIWTLYNLEVKALR